MNTMDKDHRLSYLKKYGSNPVSYLTLSDSLSTLSGKWDGYIAYHQFLRAAIILGDPIVSPESYHTVINDIKNTFSSKKINICFFLCKNNIIKTLQQQGFKGFCFGQDAIINLQKFNLSGKAKWSIRSSINYAKRNNMTVEEYKYTSNRSLSIENDILAISYEWCRMKKMPELSFAFGHVDFDNFQDVRYFICRHKGKIVGFLSYYPIFGKNSYYLDLTRRGIDSPRGTIDFLTVESLETLKKEKVEKIYIGGSPLYFQSLDPMINSRFTSNLFSLSKLLFEFFYPTKSEFFFKKKYATEWEPYYIFYYPRFSIRMPLSIINAVYKGGIAALVIHRSKHILKNLSTTIK